MQDDAVKGGDLRRSDVRGLFNVPNAYQRDKISGLETAIRAHVRPGMTLHFGYAQARAIAAGHALLRCFDGQRPGFNIVSSGLVSAQAGLVSRGLVNRVQVSFLGDNYPTPAPNAIYQRALREGRLEVEPVSLLTLYQRLAAGAFGLPFAPTRSCRGSSLAADPGFAVVKNPFGEGDVGVVAAIVPDITFIHGIAADPQGNILLSPPFGENEMAAFAALKGVIATVERIVPPDVIRRHSTFMRIPAHRVLSVSEVPFGSHPYALFNPGIPDVASYVEDHAFFTTVRRASRQPEAFNDWVESWITGLPDHTAYLEKLGVDRLNSLRGAATPGAWEDDFDRATLAAVVATVPDDPIDAMIVAAARLLRDKIVANGYDIIEAGVGYANLAAWLAATALQVDEGIDVELVAEIGMYGYLPRPGDSFIFSNRNLPTAKGLLSVESVLGLYVGGRHNNCLAIIGAGQIDAAGNINSTFGADGTFLVGSGGANDITSAARETIVVTQQSAKRLVRDLPYITAPGAGVSTLVTDLGIYQKRNGRFVLVGYHERVGVDQRACIEQIRETCGWAVEIGDQLRCTAPPTPRERQRLHLFDLRKDFLSRERGNASR